MTRTKYILALASNPEFASNFELVTAFCYCLTPRQACSLLVEAHSSHVALRDTVLRKVCKDIGNSYSLAHQKLVKQLLADFSRANMRERQSLGYCLSTLAEHIPSTERRTIQRVFLQSKYVSVRRRGYKSLSTEHNVPRHLVQKAWLQFQDEACAWLIVKTFPVRYLVQHREALASALSEGWQFARLYLRVGEENQKLLTELKAIDQISYCYVLAKLCLNLSTKEARSFVDSNSGDERFGLLIWSLGRLGQWDALKYVQAKLPEINEKKHAALQAIYGI